MHGVATVVWMALTGCAALGPMNGTWTLEVEDFDACELELDISQEAGGDLDGDAEVECVVYATLYEETFVLEYQDGGGDLSGSFDRGEVELELSFVDDVDGWGFEMVFEGELDGDELEGELFLDDDIWDMENLGEAAGDKD